MYNNKKYYSNKPNKYYNQKKSKKNYHLSKYLSLVLRHKAKDFGLDVESSGFIKLDDIINLPQSQKYSLSLSKIKEIVDNDEKGRFELVNRPPYYIRAVQGHSMSEVTNEETLSQLNKNTIFDFPTVVHGTQEEAWMLIVKSGLNKMNRNAILSGDNDIIKILDKTVNSNFVLAETLLYFFEKKCIELLANLFLFINYK